MCNYILENKQFLVKNSLPYLNIFKILLFLSLFSPKSECSSLGEITSSESITLPTVMLVLSGYLLIVLKVRLCPTFAATLQRTKLFRIQRNGKIIVTYEKSASNGETELNRSSVLQEFSMLVLKQEFLLCDNMLIYVHMIVNYS